MVAQMSMEEVNAQLAAMMADDDDEDLGPRPAAHGASEAATAQPRLPIGIDDDALLRAAMDDDWDGSSARQRPVPAIETAFDRRPVTTSHSMGYLSLPDSAIAALMPMAPPESVPLSATAAGSPPTCGTSGDAGGFYSLPSLDDGEDEFMWAATDAERLEAPNLAAAASAHSALAALAAADIAREQERMSASSETDGTEQWQGLACDIFQDPPLVPVGCQRFELPLGPSRRSVAVHPQRATFERSGAAEEAGERAGLARGGAGVGADAARMTGALLWDSAVVLASYLVRKHGGEDASAGQGASTRRCIELGAGLGLPGLVAAALGMQTTLTDRHECLPLLTAGVADNGLEATAAVRELVWGDTAAAQALAPPFDLIVASDCIYEAEVIPAFVHTLAVLLGSPGGKGEVLIAYDEAIGRPKAAEALHACAAAANLVWQPLEVEAEAQQDQRKGSVRLVRLTMPHA